MSGQSTTRECESDSRNRLITNFLVILGSGGLIEVRMCRLVALQIQSMLRCIGLPFDWENVGFLLMVMIVRDTFVLVEAPAMSRLVLVFRCGPRNLVVMVMVSLTLPLL